MKLSALRRFCLALLSVTAVVSSLSAQHALYVEHKKEMHLVRAAQRAAPMIEINGKLVPASSGNFALQKVEEYQPFFISVRDLQVRNSSVREVSSGAEFNHSFQFRAKFESPYTLDRVYLVLDMKTESQGPGLFLWEIGRLKAREPVPIRLSLPVRGGLGAGKYKLHLFVNGLEVFHSQMPFTTVETALDRMIARRAKDAPDGPPRPFVGPAPEYPDALREAGTRGRAVVAMRIGKNGRVLDPMVTEASDPSFGDATLAAIRQWRFLPAIENGRPVEKKAQMPFGFDPGEKSAKP